MAKQVTPGEYQGAAPEPPESDEPVDPNKFKDFFKIDPSEGSPGKKKRQLTKEEEEGREDEAPQVATPTDAFRSFMGGTSEDPSPFDIKAPQSVHSLLPHSEVTPQVKQTRQPIFSQEELMATPTEESDQYLFIPQTEAPPPPAPVSQPSPSDQFRGTPSVDASRNSSPSSSDETQQSQNTQPTDSSQSTSQNQTLPSFFGRKKRKPQVKKKTIAKHPPPPVISKKPDIEKVIPTTLEKPVEKAVPIAAPKEESLKELLDNEGPAKKAFPPHDIHGKPGGMESYFAELAKEKKSGPSADQAKTAEGTGMASAVGMPTGKASGDSDHEKKEKGDDHFVAEVGPLSSAQMVAAMPENMPPSMAPAYARLSPQVFELFERMVGVMTVERYGNKSSTTITLNMQNSIFHGSKISIDHYSTAPHSFNIQLQGSPEALKYFSANMGSLAEAFKSSQLPYEVNLLNPVLLKEYAGEKKKRYKRVERKEEA